MKPKNMLSAEEADNIAQSLKLIHASFDLKEGDPSEIKFGSFQAFSHYRDVYPHLLLFLSKGNHQPFVAFTQVEYNLPPSRKRPTVYREYQTWAGIKLRHNYGNLLIRHETMRDKLNELFEAEEINFDMDSGFCNRFFVLADNESKAHHLLNSTVRQQIMALPFSHLEIEVRNSTLIVGNKKTVVPEEALLLTRFVHAVSTAIT